MKIRNIALISVVCCFSMLNAATYEVSAPGTLADLAKDDLTATTLTVSGNIDARDLYFITESMTKLTELDLSGAKIEAYSSKTALFGEELSYKADMLPKMCFFNKEYTALKLPQTVTAILNGTVAGCKKLAAITVPDGVTKIDDYAFYDCDALESVEIPASVKTVGTYAFAECNALKTVTLNAESTAVPAYAFYNCTSLAGVVLPATTPAVGESAFRGCSALAEFTFPTGLKVIAEDAFKGTKLTAVVLDNCENLDSIGDWAFADNAALATVKFPINIKHIGVGAFFEDSAVENAVLPANITAVSDFLFTDCAALTDPQLITEGIVTVGKYALSGLTSLSALTVPASVEKLDNAALKGDTGLSEITVNTTAVPALGEKVFEGIDQPKVMLKVAENMIPEYKAAEQWKEFNIQNLSSAEDALAAAEVKAYFNGTVLRIEANEIIASTLLFDATGLQLSRCQGGDNTVTYETADFSNNYYIIAVKLASGKQCAIKLSR